MANLNECIEFIETNMKYYSMRPGYKPMYDRYSSIYAFLVELKERRDGAQRDIGGISLHMAIEALKEQRPHGEWEHWGSPFSDDSIANSIVCSLCKARYVEIEDEVFNFCPSCGASMISSNSEIEKSKSEIVPDYRDGWRLRGDL